MSDPLFDDPVPLPGTIVRLNKGFSLFGEWWCMPVDASEDAVAQAVASGGIHPWCAPDAPAVPLPLIRDRLFGGFACKHGAERRHAYFASGGYTYMNPDLNGPLPPERRREYWRDLVQANGEPGAGPFTEPWTPP
jgi:hypothetical protein